MIFKKRIVAFTGKARSGKDTSCEIVARILTDAGYKTRVFAFADNLKKTIADIFDLTYEDLYGKTKETPRKVNLTPELYTTKITDTLWFRCEKVLKFSKAVKLRDTLISGLKKVGKPTLLTRLGLSNTYYISPRQMQQIWGTDAVREVIDNQFWVKDLDRRLKDFLEETYAVALISDLRFDNEADWLECKDKKVLVEVQRPILENGNVYNISSHKSENGISDKYQRLKIINDGTLKDLEDSIKLHIFHQM